LGFPWKHGRFADLLFGHTVIHICRLYQNIPCNQYLSTRML